MLHLKDTMIFARLKSRDGFTLIELLLFSVIFALVTVAFVGIFIVITRIQSRETSNISVGQEAQFLTQTIQGLVHRSSLIEMTADVSTTTITLRMASSVLDPTTVYVSGGKAFLRETASGTPQALTSDRVTLSNVSFTKRSNPRAYDSIQISYVISANTTSSQQASSQTVNTSVTRRSPATFDSDIQPISGQSIRLGTTSNQIQSINGTLFFQDGSVGISPNGETPVERLQVSEGGLKFSSIPSRPTCSSSTRGTVWFREDNANGDSLAMCLLSSTGVYYWTGDLPDDFDPVVVDGPVGGISSDNVGQYSSITALTPQIGASTTVYISYYNNTRKSLMFVKSLDSGQTWTGRTEVHYTGTLSGIGHDNSIAAPTTSTIYISYYNQNNDGLWFASSSNGGTTWDRKQIDDGSGDGQYSSIAAPTTSTIYITYFGGSSDLMFAKSTDGGGTFTTSTLESTGTVGKYTSMETVGTSTIFVLYFDSSFGGGSLRLKKSINGGSSWSGPITVAVGAADVGRGNDLAAVDTSTIYAVYYDQAGANSLKFVSSTNQGDSWGSSMTLPTGGTVGQNVSIATPDGVTLFVGYQKTSGTNGFSVIRSFDRGATWPVNEVKDVGGSTGQYNAMAASDASAFASYWNNSGSNNQLKSFRTLYPQLFDD